jgi:hypothetical protein
VLPNLIIVGVHKAGTTSLYNYLSQHPEIYPSPKKEVNFFTPLILNEPLPAIQEYHSFFSDWGGERYRMEASPRYLYGKEVIAETIKREIPDVRIIIILREPVERMISFFNYIAAASRVPASMDFSKFAEICQQSTSDDPRDVYVRGIQEGFYIDYLRSWYCVFGDALKIVFFDDLKSNAAALIVDICQWLEIDPSSPFDFGVKNRTIDYRNRTLHQYIHALYRKYKTFWRRNPWLGKRLRKAYHRLNATEVAAPDPSVIRKLRLIYKPYNDELRSFLLGNQYEPLPDWLND